MGVVIKGLYKNTNLLTSFLICLFWKLNVLGFKGHIYPCTQQKPWLEKKRVPWEYMNLHMYIATLQKHKCK
jgi:hypothetical protein